MDRGFGPERRLSFDGSVLGPKLANPDSVRTAPQTRSDRLRALPNVTAVPHIGSATAETRDAMGFRALDNLDAYFAGREPRDRVA